MKLEVGGKYEQNNGDVVECVKGPDNDGDFEMSNELYYSATGRCYGLEAESIKRRIDTPETGTLKGLGVKAGDVVEDTDDGMLFKVDRIKGCVAEGLQKYTGGQWENGDWTIGGINSYRIISRASDTPKTWGEMTDAEKGALLLFEYENENFCIEYQPTNGSGWGPKHKTDAFFDGYKYRRRPEPVREVVELLIDDGGMGGPKSIGTIETVDGKPDCATIKMEPLE